MQQYRTHTQAEANIGRFIEDVYCAKRLHSSLDYLPPVEFEADRAREPRTESIVDRRLANGENIVTANPQHTNPSNSTASWAGAVPVMFLPGIVMPAALRYAPLIEELGDSTQALTKELEVYAAASPPGEYAIEREVDSISRAADAAGFERFHLYGHSAGGACALAYVATHPERILSLALDEPASDFSSEARAALQEDLDGIAGLTAGANISTFLRQQLAPGVDPPSPSAGSPPAWMANRPSGINAFLKALLRYRLPKERLHAFDRPVYYSYGSLSHHRWVAMRDRLAGIFPDFTPDLYEGLHHLETSHHREPARVASALRLLWSRAESERCRPGL